MTMNLYSCDFYQHLLVKDNLTFQKWYIKNKGRYLEKVETRALSDGFSSVTLKQNCVS